MTISDKMAVVVGSSAAFTDQLAVDAQCYAWVKPRTPLISGLMRATLIPTITVSRDPTNQVQLNILGYQFSRKRCLCVPGCVMYIGFSSLDFVFDYRQREASPIVVGFCTIDLLVRVRLVFCMHVCHLFLYEI